MAANTNALDLELSSSQYIWAADHASLDLSTAVTMRFWAKREAISGASAMTMIGKRAADSSTVNYQVGWLATDKLFFYYRTGGVDHVWETTATFTDTTAYHFITCKFTYGDGSSIKICHDSATAEAGSWTAGDGTAAAATDANRLSIGAAYAGAASQFVDGLVDEVGLYSSAITEATLYENRFNDISADSNLQLYAKLNNDYDDASANNHTITAEGTPAFSATVPFANYGGDVSGFLSLNKGYW